MRDVDSQNYQLVILYTAQNEFRRIQQSCTGECGGLFFYRRIKDTGLDVIEKIVAFDNCADEPGITYKRKFNLWSQLKCIWYVLNGLHTGDWHTHPPGASGEPSITDLEAVALLRGQGINTYSLIVWDKGITLY